MIFPKIITDSLLIIPVYSHGHAKSLIAQHEEAAILYYILPQKSAISEGNIIIEEERKRYTLHLYCKSISVDSMITLASRSEITYFVSSQRFFYQDKVFQRLENLLKDAEIEVLSKQEAATQFLNNTYLALADSDALSCKKEEKWRCAVPTDIVSGLKEPPANQAKKQVYFCYNTENEKKRIEDYIQRLEKIMSIINSNYRLEFTTDYYTIFTEYGSHKNEYIALTDNALSTVLEYQSLTAVPSLQELAFRQIAKIPDIFEQPQANREKRGFSYAKNIADGLVDKTKEKKIDLHQVKIFNEISQQPIFDDPRFLFFSYPHLKENAFQRISNTAESILIKENKAHKNLSCLLQ